MFARVVSLPIALDALSEFERRFHDYSAPMLATYPGFAGLIALTNAETGHAISTSLWDDRAALINSGYHPRVVDEVVRFGEVATGPLSRDVYEVIVQRSIDPPAVLPDELYAIATYLTVVDAAWEQVIASSPTSAPTIDPEGDGRLLVQVLAQPELRRILVLEVWTSEEHMHGTGTLAYDEPMMLRRHELFSSVQPILDLRVRAWLGAPHGAGASAPDAASSV